MKPNQKYKIVINCGSNIFTYRGFIISEHGPNFIKFLDDKDGEIDLAISQIVYKQKIKRNI